MSSACICLGLNTNPKCPVCAALESSTMRRQRTKHYTMGALDDTPPPSAPSEERPSTQAREVRVLAVGTKYVKGFADWSGNDFTPHDLQMVSLEDYSSLQKQLEQSRAEVLELNEYKILAVEEIGRWKSFYRKKYEPLEESNQTLEKEVKRLERESCILRKDAESKSSTDIISEKYKLQNDLDKARAELAELKLHVPAWEALDAAHDATRAQLAEAKAEIDELLERIQKIGEDYSQLDIAKYNTELKSQKNGLAFLRARTQLKAMREGLKRIATPNARPIRTEPHHAHLAYWSGHAIEAENIARKLLEETAGE